MNFRSVRLILMLLVVTIWADRLKVGAFYVTPRFGTTAFGQESYPLSIRDRVETQEKIEAPRLLRLDQQPVLIALITPRVVWSQLEAVVFPLISRSDTCYLFMSIQR
jgi:hypothetical protein